MRFDQKGGRGPSTNRVADHQLRNRSLPSKVKKLGFRETVGSIQRTRKDRNLLWGEARQQTSQSTGGGKTSHNVKIEKKEAVAL